MHSLPKVQVHLAVYLNDKAGHIDWTRELLEKIGFAGMKVLVGRTSNINEPGKLMVLRTHYERGLPKSIAKELLGNILLYRIPHK